MKDTVRIRTPEQFQALQKGDTIIVHWSDYFVRHTEGANKVMVYDIYDNKLSHDEIICRLKGNHYFNWKMHLGLDTPNKNTSQALEVYRYYDGYVNKTNHQRIQQMNVDEMATFIKDSHFWDCPQCEHHTGETTGCNCECIKRIKQYLLQESEE